MVIGSTRPLAVVTGAAGFCGRHLTCHLLASGYDVAGVDLADTPVEGATLHRTDILDTDCVTALFAAIRPQTVFHLAALTNPRLDYEELHRVNVLGTLSVLRAVRKACPAATVLVTSSSAVYGPVEAAMLPIREAQPFRPVSTYAASKAAQEMVACALQAEYGLRVIRARPFNLAGPGETTQFVTSALARQVAEIAAAVREPVITTWNLETTRDFTDARDAVVAYRLLAERGEPGAAYNVCSGRGTRIRVLLELLIELGGIESPEIRTATPQGSGVDVPVQVGDPRSLIARTGWGATRSLRETLQHVLAWWRERVAARMPAPRFGATTTPSPCASG